MVKKREEIVSKKEAILNEKSELEMKKLRSSQVINKVSNQLKAFLLKMKNMYVVLLLYNIWHNFQQV